MKNTDQLSGGAFDFSQDAWAFKAKLWNRLKEKAMKMESGAQALEDDDLAWVNAAGIPQMFNQKDEKEK